MVTVQCTAAAFLSQLYWISLEVDPQPAGHLYGIKKAAKSCTGYRQTTGLTANGSCCVLEVTEWGVSFVIALHRVGRLTEATESR